MKKMMHLGSLLGLAIVLTSCNVIEDFERRSAIITNYEKVALGLSKENRELKAEISRLRFKIQNLKSEKNYIQIQLDKLKSPKKAANRSLASVQKMNVKNDLVKFDVYKWSPGQMVAMAEKEFSAKNFEKSAQFFTSFMKQFPKHERINDHLLFKAGMAAFESGEHSNWVMDYMGKLVKDYPTSKFYRGAKLWMALTHLQNGDKDRFFLTVEEFRKKYRNTEEWKVLSQHYENIVRKYK
jgi:outer membrane protein assembly factor BamD (BamD/ComL family)